MKRQRYREGRSEGMSGVFTGGPTSDPISSVGKRQPPSIVTGSGVAGCFAPDSPRGGGGIRGPGPASPLTALMQNAYPSPTNASPRNVMVQGMPSPMKQQHVNCAAALPPRAPQSAPTFEGSYQQQNDPNYVGRYQRSTNGYRVTHAPGGGSSISLSWGDGNEASAAHHRPAPAQPVEPMTGGVFAAPPPTYGRAVRGPGGGQACSSSMASCLQQDAHGPGQPVGAGHRGRSPGMGACPNGAAARRVSPGLGSQARSSSLGVAGNMASGAEAPVQAFGAPGMGGLSSNAYACGANQNVGNSITDRRTTRVLKPPGGASSIHFG